MMINHMGANQGCKFFPWEEKDKDKYKDTFIGLQ